jgi:hypothetical protein
VNRRRQPPSLRFHYGLGENEPPAGDVLDEGPIRARRRLQAFASLYALVGGLVACGLLFAGLGFGAFAIGIAITLGLVSAAARRSDFPGAFSILLAYAFAFGLLIWAALFVAALALWSGWQ